MHVVCCSTPAYLASRMPCLRSGEASHNQRSQKDRTTQETGRPHMSPLRPEYHSRARLHLPPMIGNRKRQGVKRDDERQGRACNDERQGRACKGKERKTKVHQKKDGNKLMFLANSQHTRTCICFESVSLFAFLFPFFFFFFLLLFFRLSIGQFYHNCARKTGRGDGINRGSDGAIGCVSAVSVWGVSAC